MAGKTEEDPKPVPKKDFDKYLKGLLNTPPPKNDKPKGKK